VLPNDLGFTFPFLARIYEWHQTGLLAIQENPDICLRDAVHRMEILLETFISKRKRRKGVV
jgi:hypothetical protein